MIAPNLANAFGIFLMRQFIRGVPDDLIDAGRMDGASELRIVFLIVAPSVTPAIAALALFAFVYHWNSYLWPLTVLQGHTDSYPIVISLSRLLSYNRGAMNTNLVMAGATLGGASAAGPVRVPAAVLRRQRRQHGDQGMTARALRRSRRHASCARRCLTRREANSSRWETGRRRRIWKRSAVASQA